MTISIFVTCFTRTVQLGRRPDFCPVPLRSHPARDLAGTDGSGSPTWHIAAVFRKEKGPRTLFLLSIATKLAMLAPRRLISTSNRPRIRFGIIGRLASMIVLGPLGSSMFALRRRGPRRHGQPLCARAAEGQPWRRCPLPMRAYSSVPVTPEALCDN